MNYSHNNTDVDPIYNTKIHSLKNSLIKEIFKRSSSNKKPITLNNEEIFSNLSEYKISSINQKKINHKNQKLYIPRYEDENEENEEEEEINSDEYISSTNLDVDTNTYINMTNNTKNKEIKNIIETKNHKNIINYPGRIRNKILNNNIYNNTNNSSNNNDTYNNTNKIDENKKNDNNYIFLMNKKEYNYDDQKLNIYNNNYNNNISVNIKRKINNKSEYINNSLILKNEETKKNSTSLEKKSVFTPNNEEKKKYKIIRNMIFKKLETLHNNKKEKNTQQQINTINIMDYKNINNLKLINNKIIKNYIKLNLNLNKKNKTTKITNKNSINNNSIINNSNYNDNKNNLSGKEIMPNMPTNHNIEIPYIKKI